MPCHKGRLVSNSFFSQLFQWSKATTATTVSRGHLPDLAGPAETRAMAMVAPVDEGDLGVDAAVSRARVAEKAGLHHEIGKNFMHTYSCMYVM